MSTARRRLSVPGPKGAALFIGALLLAATAVAWHAGGAAVKAKPGATTLAASSSGATAGACVSSNFACGEPQASSVGASTCGPNFDGEPQLHVSRANNLFLGSERGLSGGSDGWNQVPTSSGTGATGCSLKYVGQPNAVAGIGASGGDIDIAWGSAIGSSGNYPLYVASLNGGSVAVAHSTDNGNSFVNVPVQGGLPVDDREWIAAYGAQTSLLTYHAPLSTEIDVLRSDNGGVSYAHTAVAIPATDYKATANELGNLVIDHLNSAGTQAGPLGQTGFWAYQSFVAPATANDYNFNEAFVAVSNDGGYTWTDRGIACSHGNTDLDHQFPNVSVDPNGNLWAAWSDDSNVFVSESTDHGSTWPNCTKVSSNTGRAVMPWLVATSAGVDLVYYGEPSGSSTWYVYFTQDLPNTTGFSQPQQVAAVHQGSICEGGISCTSGRQLLDDFGVDTDQSGFAHIAYSMDADSNGNPSLGAASSATGYAVQTAGTAAGKPN